MLTRPYVIASAAVSLDGYLDDATETRLLLSNEDDFERVDALRASVDAILVGAGTIRADDPRLLVRSAQRRDERVAAGKPENPAKITISMDGQLDPAAQFFIVGESARVVYVPDAHVTGTAARLRGCATVAAMGEPADVLADLASRGIETLLIEGGGQTHTLFLTANLVDELQLAVAPFFVGQAQAPRFVYSGAFPHNSEHPMTLLQVERLGEVVLLRYRMRAL